MSGTPDRVPHIFLVPHVVLLLLLDVVVLAGAAVVSTQGLVKTSMGLITSLEGSVVGHKSLFLSLISEGLACSESKDVGVESSVLTHDMVEGLVLVQNEAILFGVIFPRDVFLSLVGIF